MAMLTAVTLPAPNRCRSLSLKRLERIVPTKMVAEMIPAKEIGTLISACSTGHADPRRESGRPRLMKQM